MVDRFENELKSVCDSTPRGRWRLTEGEGGKEAGTHQYWHQKRSMGASLGRASTVLKHSNAGMAYPKSSLRAGRRRRTRFRNQRASAKAKNQNKALPIRPAGPAKEAAAFEREEFGRGLTAGSSTGAPPTSRRARNGGRPRRSVSQPAAAPGCSRPPLYLWSRVERRWRNGSGEEAVGRERGLEERRRRRKRLRWLREDGCGRPATSGRFERCGAWAAGSTVAVCRVLGRGGVGPSVRAGGLDPFHPSGHDRR